MIKIACIILHYRKPDDTRACLASLARSGASAWKIFLVNNSPEDGSAPCLDEALRGVGGAFSVLTPGYNSGFAGGCNIGIRSALEEGFTHVVLLNNDVDVADDFVSEVEKSVAAHPNEVLAGDIKDEAGYPTHNIGRLSPLTGRVRHILKSGYDGEIDFVSGCLMILPRVVLDRVGFFDEALFMYCEDMDLCMRFRDNGVRIRYVPAIRICHKFDRLKTRSGIPKEYYIQRNQAYLILRRGTLVQRIVHAAYLLALPAYKFLRHRNLFVQAVRGAYDGVRGRLGMRHVDG